MISPMPNQVGMMPPIRSMPTGLASASNPAQPTMQPATPAYQAPAAPVPNTPMQQVPQTGLIGSNQIINQGVNQTVGALGAGAALGSKYLSGLEGNTFSADTSVGAGVTDPLNQASANFNGYMQGGQNASKLQADLSGANGQSAQQAAYAQYQSSPAMQYQMDQMQKATERSAASRGGLLSGNVLAELQRNASGIAAQDYQNQFNNLGQVAGQGLSAAGQVAGLKSTQANIAGQLQNTGIQANLQASLANQEQKYNVAKGLSDLANQYGINVGNVFGSAAGVNAANAYNAGTAIANNANNAATNISNLLSQQGVNISNSMASDINSMTNILAQYGLNDQQSNQNLAAMIANITGGQATNTMNAYNTIGAAGAQGALNTNTAIQGGLQNAFTTGLIGNKKSGGEV